MERNTTIDLIQQVGYKQLHTENWRCRECMLTADLVFGSAEELEQHLKDIHGIVVLTSARHLSDGEMYIQISSREESADEGREYKSPSIET
jgi:hypothetical protein